MQNNETSSRTKNGHSNKGTPNAKRKKLSKVVKEMPRKSPKKAKKGTDKKGKKGKNVAKAVFMDEATEMVIEVTNQEESQFGSEGERPDDNDNEVFLRNKHVDMESRQGSKNNNAVISQADKFRPMVSEASEWHSVDEEDGFRSSQDTRKTSDSSIEEGEASNDSDLANESLSQ